MADTRLVKYSGRVGELVVVRIVGFYLGLDPNLYLRGVASLIPQDKRQRSLPVLREIAHTPTLLDAGTTRRDDRARRCHD